jgi:hypothetical protein
LHKAEKILETIKTTRLSEPGRIVTISTHYFNASLPVIGVNDRVFLAIARRSLSGKGIIPFSAK